MYKFIFTVADDESVKVAAQDFSGNSSEIPAELNVDTLANFDFSAVLKESAPRLIPDINKSVSESLHENVTLLEYGPLDFIKNAMHKHAAKKADKAAEKQAAKNAQDLHNQALAHFADGIKDLAKDFDSAVAAIGLKSDSKINKDSAEFSILPKSAAYFTVQLSISKDDPNTLIVNKVFGPDGKEQSISGDLIKLDTFIENMGKTLGINLQEVADNAEEAAKEASDDSEQDGLELSSEEEAEGIEASLDLDTDDDKLTVNQFKDKYISRQDTLKDMSDKNLRKLLVKVAGTTSGSMLNALDKETLLKVALGMLK